MPRVSPKPSELFHYTGPDLEEPGYTTYKHLRDDCELDCEYLEECWTKFKQLGLADPDFLARFPAECPERIWEMRLACILAGWGIDLVPSPRRGAGMDYGIRLKEGRTVWVEATAPRSGEGADQVWAPNDTLLFGAEIERTTGLRYLNSIAKKREQFERAIQAQLVAPNDGLIIAISGVQIPLTDHQTPGEAPLIVKVLFGLGDSPFLVDLHSGRSRRGPPMPRPSFRKSRGSNVPSRLFLTPDAGEVTGVLFDPYGPKNRPETRGCVAGHDFIFVHNPHARVPLNIGQFGEGQEFFIRLDSIQQCARAEKEPT
ncbi:hypothetical protein D7Y15_33175 [Corallococcus sp. AB030]|nr:hypothetical protein D7Y15_33175 [Corallococcus sp. AB030]